MLHECCAHRVHRNRIKVRPKSDTRMEHTHYFPFDLMEHLRSCVRARAQPLMTHMHARTVPHDSIANINPKQTTRNIHTRRMGPRGHQSCVIIVCARVFMRMDRIARSRPGRANSLDSGSLASRPVGGVNLTHARTHAWPNL